MEELIVLAKIGCKESCYGALLALRSVYGPVLPTQYSDVKCLLEERLIEVGWVVQTNLPDNRSSEWFIRH